MRLRILPLMILLLLLPTLGIFAQTPPESSNGQNSGFEIEPTQSYPGTVVLELMEAAETEIDAAVREAYAEGYKAASARFMPELAVKNNEIASLQADRQKRWLNYFITAGLSLLGGVVVGVIIAGQ